MYKMIKLSARYNIQINIKQNFCFNFENLMKHGAVVHLCIIIRYIYMYLYLVEWRARWCDWACGHTRADDTTDCTHIHTQVTNSLQNHTLFPSLLTNLKCCSGGSLEHFPNSLLALG